MPSDGPDTKPTPLEDLLCAVSTGNTDAWKELGPRLTTKLQKYFDRRFDWDRAQELTQDTLAAIVRQLPGFVPELSYRQWVYGIARNVAAAAFRERYQCRVDHEFDIEADLVDQTTSVSSKVAAAEVREIVRDEVKQLKPHLRVVIEHDLNEDDDLDALAASEQVKRPTMRTRRYRGQQDLRKPLSKRLDIPDSKPPPPPKRTPSSTPSVTPENPRTPKTG